MSDYDFIPKQDAVLPVYLTELTGYANANLTALGLVAADLTPVTTGATNYQTALNTLATAKAAYKQAVIAKNAAKRAATGNVRTLAHKVQSNPAVLPAQKAAMGLTPRLGIKKHPAPAMPTDFKATPHADGTNVLTWKKSTNIPGTVYKIEAMTTRFSEWMLVDSTTSTRYLHKGQTPGAMMVYRVTASRAKRSSVPSLTASVYAPTPIPQPTPQPIPQPIPQPTPLKIAA